MNGLDIGLIVVIVAIGIVGMIRGFGRTMLDTLALYAGLWGASLAAPMLAARLSLHAGGMAINQSWTFCLLFLVFGILLLGISWYVYGMTQFDAGMFDKLLGLATGLAAGAIVAHSVVAAMVTADPKCVASASMVSTGAVSHEMYSFSSYHAVMDTITGVKTYMRNDTDVAGK